MIYRNSCPLCNSNDIVNYKKIRSSELEKFITDYYNKESYIKLKPFLDEFINYMKCNNCNLIFQQNILDDDGMAILYEEAIDSEQSLQKRLNFSLQQNFKSIVFFKNILRNIHKKPSQIRVVDFGMGFGQNLCQLKALGCINSYGIELSENRIKYAKENFGVLTFDNLNSFNDESIDLLIANQVLEHIPNLREVLDTIEKKISKGGFVLIAVPNGEQNKNILSKGPFHPLEHINTFIPISKNYLFSKNMKFKFMLKNIFPAYKTTWLFYKK